MKINYIIGGKIFSFCLLIFLLITVNHAKAGILLKPIPDKFQFELGAGLLSEQKVDESNTTIFPYFEIAYQDKFITQWFNTKLGKIWLYNENWLLSTYAIINHFGRKENLSEGKDKVDPTSGVELNIVRSFLNDRFLLSGRLEKSIIGGHKGQNITGLFSYRFQAPIISNSYAQISIGLDWYDQNYAAAYENITESTAQQAPEIEAFHNATSYTNNIIKCNLIQFMDNYSWYVVWFVDYSQRIEHSKSPIVKNNDTYRAGVFASHIF
jgi:outer membrane scaffolding protein for murein synthesis (MipA/OmpV family)